MSKNISKFARPVFRPTPILGNKIYSILFYTKRKLKYSRYENFNLLYYVEWDRIVTLAGAKTD